MEQNELKKGMTACHRKHSRNYRVISKRAKMKDSVKGWIECVIYQPLYENPDEMFGREKGSFLKEFDAVSEIPAKPEYTDIEERSATIAHTMAQSTRDAGNSVSDDAESFYAFGFQDGFEEAKDDLDVIATENIELRTKVDAYNALPWYRKIFRFKI